MVGLGEDAESVVETMTDLRRVGVDIVTLGQYLRPTQKHAPVQRFVTPAEFAEYERAGYELGFAFVASGPLVRSSYHAAEGFVQARFAPGANAGAQWAQGDAVPEGDRVMSPPTMAREALPPITSMRSNDAGLISPASLVRSPRARSREQG